MPQTEDIPPEPRMKPNINEVLVLLAAGGEIEKGEKKQQDGMSELGGIYRRVEKTHHANRAAVSFIRRMQKMSDDKRNDLIRTLEPLMVRLGYTMDDIEPDLADQAESQAAAPGKTDDGDAGDEDNGDAGDASEADAEDGEEEKPLSAMGAALAEARSHLSGGAQSEDEANTVVRNIASAPKKKLGIGKSAPAGTH
jgi:hypothetical protein